MELVSVGDSGSVAVMVTTDNVLVLSGEDGYLSNLDGSVTVANTFNCSEYIPCKAGEPLWLVSPNYDSANSDAFGYRVGFYDTDKRWVKTFILRQRSKM